jgi:heme exporter protein CcmD
MIGAVLAMDNAGYIIGSYAITVAVIGGFATYVLRKGRRLADQVDDADKYWT